MAPRVTLTEARELLNVSRRTLFNWIKAGKLATVKVRHSTFVLVSSIEAVKAK